MARIWLPPNSSIARAARGWPGPNVPPLEPLMLSDPYARATVAFGPDLTRPNFGTLIGDLTTYGAPRYQVGGTYFDGSNDYIDSASNVGFDSYAFAIRFKNTGTTDKDGGLVTIWYLPVKWELFLWLDTNEGQHRLGIASSDSGVGTDIDFAADGSIQRDKTYIATCQATSSTVTVRLYSDTGQLIDTLSVINRSTQSRKLRIGARVSASNKLEGFIYGFWYAETGVLLNQDQIARDFYGTLFKPANQSPYLISLPDATPAPTSTYYLPAYSAVAKAARGWPSSPLEKPVGTLRLAAASPLAAMPFNGNFLDLKAGAIRLTDGTPTGSWKTDGPGLSWDFARDSNNSIFLDGVTGRIGTNNFLWSIYYKSNHSGPSLSFFGTIVEMGTEATGFYIRRWAWQNNIKIRLSHNWKNIQYEIVGGADGNWHHIVAGRIFNNLVVFYDGVQVHNAPPDGASLQFSNSTRISGNAEPFDGQLASCLLEGGPSVTMGTARKLAQAPFSPWLEPANQSPYLISAPSAATGTTLSLPTESVTGQNTATVGCTVAIS